MAVSTTRWSLTGFAMLSCFTIIANTIDIGNRTTSPDVRPTIARNLLPTFPRTTAEICGTALVRIVGGHDALPGRWPWHVSLQGGGFCEGSLINKEWVLTSANCLRSDDNPNVWTIILGLQYLDGLNPNEIRRTAAKIILHHNRDPSTHDNDIALVRLTNPVTFTDYIRPVCLAASGSIFHTGSDHWVTGWGDIGVGEPLTSPGNLQEVSVPVMENEECDNLLESVQITENMICTGQLEGGKGFCMGDSGSPLVYQLDAFRHTGVSATWVQAGVVSFGYGCARPKEPGVYSRVSRYQDWIRNHIKSDPPRFIQVVTSTRPPVSTTASGPKTTTTPLPPVFTSQPASGSKIKGSVCLLTLITSLIFCYF